MLSIVARAYLIYQVYDYILRKTGAVRFSQLKEELEDLAAWPEFQEAAINDPRFLVVEDYIDIAISGIHASSDIEEIFIKTIDLLRVPVSDFFLNRFVRRLRPELSSERNPIQEALDSGSVFRTRDSYLALSSWLIKVHPLKLPDWVESNKDKAGYEILKAVGQPLNAVSLAASISERFNISIREAYITLASDVTLLLLPDGTITIYDKIVDELSFQCHKNNQTYEPEYVEAVVPVSKEFAYVELPSDFLKLVLQRCHSSRIPISTSEIIQEILAIKPRDQRYVASFRTVTSVLGKSAELIPVGANLWYPASLIPEEAFRFIFKNKNKGFEEETHKGEQFKHKGKLYASGANKKDHISIPITEVELDKGCLSNSRLGLLLPAHPMLQVVQWKEVDNLVWYNSQYNTLYGLSAWFANKAVQPGEIVVVKIQEGQLNGNIIRRATNAKKREGQTQRNRPRSRSLFLAIRDNLANSGGTLAQEELMALLNEEDPEITWDEVELIIERTPAFRFYNGYCYFNPKIYSEGKNIDRITNSNVQTRIINILTGLTDVVRSKQEVLDLIQFVSLQPRISPVEEKLLIKSAQNGDHAALERLVTSHLRQVLRQLLHRIDIEELLTDIEDYFQVGVIGLIEAISKFDCEQPVRLQNYMGWKVKTAIDRAKPWYIYPVRFPDFFFDNIEKIKKQIDNDSLLEKNSMGGLEHASKMLVKCCLEDHWQVIDLMMVEYEENGTSFLILENEWEDELALKELIDISLKSLKPREADVIIRYFGLNGQGEENFEDIGLSYGVTRSRVQQIHSKAIMKIKRELEKMKIFD